MALRHLALQNDFPFSRRPIAVESPVQLVRNGQDDVVFVEFIAFIHVELVHHDGVDYNVGGNRDVDFVHLGVVDEVIGDHFHFDPLDEGEVTSVHLKRALEDPSGRLLENRHSESTSAEIPF